MRYRVDWSWFPLNWTILSVRLTSIAWMWQSSFDRADLVFIGLERTPVAGLIALRIPPVSIFGMPPRCAPSTRGADGGEAWPLRTEGHYRLLLAGRELHFHL